MEVLYLFLGFVCVLEGIFRSMFKQLNGSKNPHGVDFWRLGLLEFQGVMQHKALFIEAFAIFNIVIDIQEQEFKVFNPVI